MASSILLQRPNLVAGAVLIRPLSPAPQATYPQLTGKRILNMTRVAFRRMQYASGSSSKRAEPRFAPTCCRQVTGCTRLNPH
jgi:hypothetical protein